MSATRLFKPFLILLALFVGTQACTTGSASAVSPVEASRRVAAGSAYLVDVREADELAESGTAQGALWMPLSKLEQGTPEMNEFLGKIAPGGDKSKEVILFCRSGRRSGVAAEKLSALGFKTANMGGFQGWVDAGLPTMPKP